MELPLVREFVTVNCNDYFLCLSPAMNYELFKGKNYIPFIFRAPLHSTMPGTHLVFIIGIINSLSVLACCLQRVTHEVLYRLLAQ